MSSQPKFTGIQLRALVQFKRSEIYKQKQNFFSTWRSLQLCKCPARMCPCSSMVCDEHFYEQKKELSYLHKILRRIEALEECPKLVPKLLESGYL